MYKEISSLMTHKPIVVNMDSPIEQIENMMDLHSITYVPVVDNEGVVFGIITARDLLHFHSSKKNAKAVFAWEICTHRPVMVEVACPIVDAVSLMVERKIHHILVTDHGTLVGIVSSFDLVEKYILGKHRTDTEERSEREFAPVPASTFIVH